MIRVPTYSLDQEQQDINEEVQKRKAEGSQTIKAKRPKQEPEAQGEGMGAREPGVKIGRPGVKKITMAVQKLEQAILDVQGKIATISAPEMMEIVPPFFTPKLNAVLAELQTLRNTWKAKWPRRARSRPCRPRHRSCASA